MESQPPFTFETQIFFDAKVTRRLILISVSGGEQTASYIPVLAQEDGGILSRELFSSWVIFFV